MVLRSEPPLWYRFLCQIGACAIMSFCAGGEIPHHLYKLPVIGSNRAIRTSSLLAPVEMRTEFVAAPKGELCEGACISSRACKYYGGSAAGICINDNVCCRFERSCDGVSREKISFFTSPGYPNWMNKSLECSNRIYPNEDVCALKVDFLELKMARGVKYAGGSHKCLEDNVYFLNTKNPPHESLCDFEGYSAVLPVTGKSEKPITIHFVIQSAKLVRWKLRVTQINCRKLAKWKNEANCGRQMTEGKTMRQEEPEAPPMLISGNEFDQELPPGVSPFVVHGDDIEVNEFPWHANIKAGSAHRCGASIINKNFLLTAAHCFAGRAYEKPEKLMAVVGQSEDGDEDGFEYPVKRVYIDFDYKSFKNHKNDIAIVELENPIKYTEFVQPVCLAGADFITEGKTGWVSGSGRLNATSSAVPENIQKLEMRIIPNSECRQVHWQEVVKSMNNSKNLNATLEKYDFMGNDNTHVCAYGVKDNSTVCFGDSGGPLVMDNKNGSFTQIGIVSYGLNPCDVENILPLAFTRVSEFLQFIAVVTASDG